MKEEILKLGITGINVRYSLENKPVVLLLHFSGGNSYMWDGIVAQLKQEYSIIAPDFRGHGKSDKPAAGYHIDDMANDMYLLLKYFNIDKCHIIGSSMGAEVGLSLASVHPELVLSFVCEGALYNEFGEYGVFNGSLAEIEKQKEIMRGELAKREEKIFARIEDYVEAERAELMQSGIWNEYFKTFFEHNLQPLADGKFTYCYLNHVRNEYIQKYWDLKLEDYYKKVKCKILFLPSEEERQDEKICYSLSVFAGLLETYEIEYIKNSLHAYVWMQLPAEAGRVAKNFIDKYNKI